MLNTTSLIDQTKPVPCARACLCLQEASSLYTLLQLFPGSRLEEVRAVPCTTRLP